MKYIVLGSGAMGQIVIRDLNDFSNANDEILIADFNVEKAKEFAKSLKSKKIKVAFADAKDIQQMAELFKNTFVIINCIQYQLNLNVMKACLIAKTHYIDLGGLFHVTKEQLKLNSEFKKIGKLALVGMGAAPGITNILARKACDALDEIEEIHTRVAGVDNTKYNYLPALSVSYSLQTILEEFSLKPAYFKNGKMTFVEPMSGRNEHPFPKPIGNKKPMHTIHSEVATLPYSYKNKGVKEVSFKIAFDDDFLNKVKFLRDMGLASNENIKTPSGEMKPIELINKIAMSQKPARRVGKSNMEEVVRAVVKGKRFGKKLTYILDCHTKGLEKWKVGTDINTGSPPAVAALMMANSEIKGKGVLPPEKCVPPDVFFKHLSKRKLWLTESVKNGWEYPT